PSPFQHFWSLAVEEQFYFVWPTLFVTMLGVGLGRHRRGRERVLGSRFAAATIGVAAIAVASLAWSIYYTQASPKAAYFSTLARTWELALGALLAFAFAQRRRLEVPSSWRLLMGWSGVVAMCVAAVAYSSSTEFPGYAALLPALGACAVIAAGMSPAHLPWGAGRFLSARPLRYIGDRSYAFYLWHWPVLVIATQHSGRTLSVGTNLLLLLL